MHLHLSLTRYSSFRSCYIDMSKCLVHSTFVSLNRHNSQENKGHGMALHDTSANHIVPRLSHLKLMTARTAGKPKTI